MVVYNPNLNEIIEYNIFSYDLTIENTANGLFNLQEGEKK